MARPKNEGKRKAILEAAIKVFAERGVGNAPTAEISRRAGIAEGTLFTYFKTKDDLAVALYQQIGQELAAAMSDLPRKQKIRRRMRSIWNFCVRWGVTNPERFKILAQLEKPDVLTDVFRSLDGSPSERIRMMVREAREQECIQENLSGEYIASVFKGLITTTTFYIAEHPLVAEETLAAGFKVFWSGIRRKGKSRPAK